MTTLPLYAIPGLMNDARVWMHVTQAFSGERTVRVADSSTHDRIEALAAAALADAPAERFALAGFSLGGYVALEMIRRAPGRVAALALVDTGARADTPEATALRERMVAAVGAAASNFDAVAAGFLPRLVHPSRVGDTELAGLLSAMAKRVGVDGFVRQQGAAMHRIDSRPFLDAIRCPTLVLCGREDQTTPLALSEEMNAAIPDARLVIVEDCGHMAPLERPEAVVDAMRDWLASADERGGTGPSRGSTDR